MIGRILLAVSMLVPGLAAGAEADLFVTDYNEDPSADQKPLVARPLTCLNPQRVTLLTAEGETETYQSPTKVVVERGPAGDPRTAEIFACPGESEPFSFLLRPRQTLESVFITASDLTGPAGTIAAEHLALASVERFHGGGRDVLVGLGRSWNMPAYSAEFFWCDVRVPDGAGPGTYRGELRVTSAGQTLGTIRVVLEMLPIRLEDPPFALGLNYSHPKDPHVLEAHLADMRRHGMTCVAPLYEFHLPVRDGDTGELGGFLEAYEEAGFPAPVYFATPMGLQLSELAGYGNETSKRWQQKYIQVMRRLHEEILKHDVPVVISIGDELTNKGIEGVEIAKRLARFVWEELPEIATASDMNGYMEVMAMAPYLNVAAFNNGWDGIDHHNKGRHLINKDFILKLQEKTGAIPWFVNGGCSRFAFGFFFWKATQWGVRGKVEWYYNLRNERGSLVRTEGTRVFPTLDYERCAEGIDDLRYLCKLEKLIAEAKQSGKAAEERREAEVLLRKIAEGIHDDWTAYRRGGEQFPPPGWEIIRPQSTAGISPSSALRRAVADRIVALQKAMR